jgi:hypothetical protein
VKDLKKELSPGLMFIATYPASFLPEHGKGFHVRFPDFPEALTG